MSNKVARNDWNENHRQILKINKALKELEGIYYKISDVQYTCGYDPKWAASHNPFIVYNVDIAIALVEKLGVAKKALKGAKKILDEHKKVITKDGNRQL